MNTKPDWKLVTDDSPTSDEAHKGIELYSINGSKSLLTQSYLTWNANDWTHWRFVERAAPPIPPKGPHDDENDAAFKRAKVTSPIDLVRSSFHAGRESLRQEVRDAIMGADQCADIAARCETRARITDREGRSNHAQSWRNLAAITR